jgi:mycothiol S-conjugate amidase
MSTAPRLLFVHAHPDDESSKGAASAARYVDEGARVVLVTCTDGGAGEILNPSHPELDPADLVATRDRELAAAIDVIGFDRAHLLGYPDSGLPEDPEDLAPDCFARLPLDETAGRLADVLRAERPHVVVTYPPDGGYPHPDHIRVHDVTMRALELARDDDGDVDGWAVPRTVFVTGFSRARMQALHEGMLAAGHESPYDEWLERDGDRDADRDPDIRVDVAAWIDRRDDALRAHATQVDPEGTWFTVPREVERSTFPWDTFCILDGVPAPDGADSVFAGLDLGD